MVMETRVADHTRYHSSKRSRIIIKNTTHIDNHHNSIQVNARVRAEKSVIICQIMAHLTPLGMMDIKHIRAYQEDK